jgi:hypothetical protein
LLENFNLINDYFMDLKLVINKKKTQFMIFKSSHRTIHSNIAIKIDDNMIQASDQLKLLGFCLDKHLTMKDHIDQTVKKCQGKLGILRRSAQAMPTKLLKLFYISFIRPHLEYCSPLLITVSKTHMKKLDVIQKIASRIILRMPPQTHSAPLLHSLQLEDLEIRRIRRIIKLIDDSYKGQGHPCLQELIKQNATIKKAERNGKKSKPKQIIEVAVSLYEKQIMFN